ncbi:cytochrome c-type biogenesis CcmF C-terminal domain-containing protein [Demequina sp. SO4-13]|uniref:cytochrome c-type biogenesis CcmF C-terminal domain-containing protein n=1 Tax=Demequina sp. SO4-13 TaxID=3401027 RepID=UPI003AF9292C
MTLAGTALLIAVMVLSGTSAGAWWAAARRTGDPARMARLLGWASGAAALAAAGVMIVALVTGTSSLAYAQRAVEPGMPLYYRVTALWAGTEGSLLLWLVVSSGVAVWFAAVTAQPGSHRSRHVAAAVLQCIVVAFAVVAVVAQPFAGMGDEVGARPSPLLQDHPAMGVHPPLLYAGFALLGAPFALAVGAASTGSWGTAWWRSLHRWTLLAWIPLTAGIALGAWWSYAVLGWGGYWAWDPVENASLLPWLAATVLLHSAGRTTRRANALQWATTLALAGYPLVVIATFLTRSGVVASVHTFSVSPLGPLLAGLAATACAAAIFVAVRASWPSPVPERGIEDVPLVVHRWGVVAVLLIVLAGSLLPAVVEAVSNARVSVGPPWFETVLSPIGLVLLAAMAAGPWLRSGERGGLTVAMAVLAVAAAVLAVVTRDLALTSAGALAAFVVASAVVRGLQRRLASRAAMGSTLSHVGVAIGAVALVWSGMVQVSERTVGVGEAMEAGGVTAVLVAVDETVEERRTVEMARVLIARGNAPVQEVQPELRWYHEHDAVLAGPAIDAQLWADVYVTVLGVDHSAQRATLRVAVNPMMPWLWASVVLMMAGVIVAGAPGRPRHELPSASPAAVRSSA